MEELLKDEFTRLAILLNVGGSEIRDSKMEYGLVYKMSEMLKKLINIEFKDDIFMDTFELIRLNGHKCIRVELSSRKEDIGFLYNFKLETLNIQDIIRNIKFKNSKTVSGLIVHNCQATIKETINENSLLKISKYNPLIYPQHIILDSEPTKKRFEIGAIFGCIVPEYEEWIYFEVQSKITDNPYRSTNKYELKSLNFNPSNLIFKDKTLFEGKTLFLVESISKA